jgi:hypothetical protein
MPIIIQGGVGALYRIQAPVMTYCFYLLATCVLDMVFLLTLFYEADMCTTVMPKEYVNMGSHFVCGMTDSALFLGFLVGGAVFLYFCFIVWSCAQEIVGWKPALLKKEEEYDEEDEYEERDGYYSAQPQYPQGYPGMPAGYGGMPQGGQYGSLGSQPGMPGLFGSQEYQDLGKGNWKTMSELPGPTSAEGGPPKISKSYLEPELD